MSSGQEGVPSHISMFLGHRAIRSIPESNPQEIPRVSYHTVVTLSKCMVPSSSSGEMVGPSTPISSQTVSFWFLLQALCPAPRR